ncbi:ABC transporter permease [Aurantimonas sp. C2-6-R+9]|uniref:ABC transporter permease n=1 Tax=unclassified Aurantimonas TaxID=2638230 RepID=UPI002E1866E2|nr:MULTISPECIES: ABC transporter permease [unclassified Aurantimonas]MEC5289936.1 ABC transporter permease [Aurantimonas sp. C2-3-R2]MEC5379924.1 ABC transporter permease [Aurantimonas sp. C2-6-R+9]MEC5414076.1 ABC transporter permease [Aurantimonas sp. C2-4-R8]
MLEGSTAQSTGASGRRRTVQPALEGEKRDGALVLRASGDWLARTVGSLEQTVDDTAGADLGRSVVVDCAGVERIDTAGAFVLEKMTRDIAASDRDVRIEGVDARDEALFAAVRQAMDRECPQPAKQRANRLVKVLAGTGGGVIAMKDEIVFALNIIGGSIFGASRRLTGKTQFRPAAIFNQLDQMGVKAVPIIVLMSFLIGGIIAQQGAFQLRRFGGEVYAVNLAGILVLREIGVLLTAIMIAGRSGSAITAEIGSMKMREEVDALHVIGLNPISVLIFPRLVALTIALPLLTFVSNLAALLGAMLTLRMYSGISFANFLQGLQQSIDLFTIFAGLIKAPFMAIIIGLVASAEGLKVGGSAESLGLHVTAAVVKSIFLVILLDGIFAIFYASIGL